MPMRQGTALPASMVPMPFLPGGVKNPLDWASIGFSELDGLNPTAMMRGSGGAMAGWQRRQIPQTPTVGQGLPAYIYHENYSRGAQAYSPKFGVLPISPIGAGVQATYKLPVFGPPGARYQFAAIWFDVQTVPTSLQASPTMPMSAVNAAIMQSSVAAMYPTTG